MEDTANGIKITNMHGYRIKTTNTHSIFELVKPQHTYTVVDSRDSLSSESRLAIQKMVRDAVGYTISVKDDAPFGWKGLATKQDGLEYQGSFLKRLTNYLYKTEKIALPPQVVGKMGNLVGKDAFKGDDTRKLYRQFDPYAMYSVGEFGDDGSCFWDGRQGARVLIRNEGGCFVEFFSTPYAYIDEDYHGVRKGTGLARAWLLPVNQFLSRDDPSFVLCNVYVRNEQKFSRFVVARTVATVLGMSYASTEVHSNLDVLWINSHGGFLISPDPQLLQDTSTIQLHYSDSYEGMDDPYLEDISDGCHHICQNCGARVHDDDYYGDEELCPECFDNEYFVCDSCGDHCLRNDDEMVEVKTSGGWYINVCEHCATTRYNVVRCDNCNT